MTHRGDTEARRDSPSSLRVKPTTVVIALSSLMVGMLLVLLIANRAAYHRWQVERLHSRLSGTAGASRLHELENLMFGGDVWGRIHTHLEALVDLGKLEKHALRVRAANEGSPRCALLLRELQDGVIHGTLVDFLYARGDLMLWCPPEHSANWHEFIAEFNAAGENSTGEGD